MRLFLRLDTDSLSLSPAVTSVFVFRHTNVPNLPLHPERDIILNDYLPLMRPYCPPERLDAEDPLFLLYTSGEYL